MDERRGGEELGRVEEGKNHTRAYYMKKITKEKYLFKNQNTNICVERGSSFKYGAVLYQSQKTQVEMY